MRLKLKEVVWVGNSKRKLKEFPREVRKTMGDALFFAQAGERHQATKLFKGIKPGVLQIAEDYKTDTYRAVYTVKIGHRIYVLHAFQKKSKTGIKTPQKEIDLIKKRLKRAQDIEKELKNE